MVERLKGLTQIPGGYYAIGVERGGVLVGGALYTDYRPCPGGGQLQVWAVGEGNWLSRRVIAALLGHPFQTLNCHRITALVAKGNRKSRKLLEDLGFREEGKCRRGYDTRTDLIIYGMLREEQGWV